MSKRNYFDIDDEPIRALTVQLRDRTEGTPFESIACDAASNIEQLMRQRDEARTEVERLRSQLMEWRNWSDDVAPPWGSARDRSDAGQRAHIAEKLTNAAWERK